MHDVLVLGAGPAGTGAAIEAASLGLSVAMIDEAATAGGQAYRIAEGIDLTADEPERRAGAVLRRDVAASSVEFLRGSRVWHVEHRADAFVLHVVGTAGASTVRGRVLVVATGAQEKHVPVPGWELPGVLGLAAATTLLKAQRVLPGRRAIVAGAGPLLAAVAYGIVKGGGSVVSVVDANPRRAWLSDPLGLTSTPYLVVRGVKWRAALAARGVRWLYGSAIARIEQADGGLRTSIATLTRDGHGECVLSGDAVCLGFGLVPATEVTRTLHASHAYDPRRGGWYVVVDHEQRTSIPGLYACGDAAGIAGAAAAPWSGRIAAVAAARDLGHVGAAANGQRSRTMIRRRDRAARFGAAMTSLSVVSDELISHVPAHAIVCLCERVTRGELDAAIDDGARSLSELKLATRCGMGSCGGRICAEGMAGWLARRTGQSRTAIGQSTVRPPFCPVVLSDLAATGSDSHRPGPAPA